MSETNEKKTGLTNSQMHKAKGDKNDEFYTRLRTVEDELWHYREHFVGKTIYCNCDDPKVSAFWEYFHAKFSEWGLKRLIATGYKSSTPLLPSDNQADTSWCKEWDGVKETTRPLRSDGDFRKPECVEILRRADIVCTNPPFSLFREYIAQLVAEKKKFLVIGNYGSVTYKEVFPLIMANKLWLGNKKLSGGILFNVPQSHADFLVANKKEGGAYKTVDGKVLAISSAVWFTNLDHKKRHKELILTAEYKGNESAYPKYDNYDAIEVGPIAKIPYDYDGVMGVTTTFLEQWNPKQFELIGIDHQVHTGVLKNIANPEWKGKLDKGYIGGKRLYARVLIKRKGV